VVREIERKAINGLIVQLVLIAGYLGAGYLFVLGAQTENIAQIITVLIGFVVLIVLQAGIFSVQPNQARVLTLFGTYVGSVKSSGLWWANPFYKKQAISLRIRNFETAKLKVNDQGSNPIEIGAIVVWQVVDSAEALFEVDNYEDYVRVQSESAVRALASQYPYDSNSNEVRSLSHNAADISEQLASEVQARLSKAGMKVIEARLAHLAYAPEIANAMLRRQQASAIIAARVLIVEGAVSMVDMALKLIDEKGMVRLDEERKAAMVSNLLVTLCAEQPMQPVVNTGSLYT
jgi:regulator of protease activity HflC (stomatin/prohibitin superfamily)